ncbi:hypothetical protein [Clostridium grantii]|nr:hypothetical protein [Clostridium grantii]
MRKIIAYQKLMLKTANMNNVEDLNNKKLTIQLIFGIFILVFMNTTIFGKNLPTLHTYFFIALPVMCLWQINSIFHYKERLFEFVPVSRKFTLLNTFIFTHVFVVITCVAIACVLLGMGGLITLLVFLLFSDNFEEVPIETLTNIVIDTTKSNILMLMVIIIILFVGTAIIFIKRKRLRNICYLISATIGYGLLYILKLNLPISPNTGEVDFMESFSVMAEANAILALVAGVGVVLCIGSVLFGNKMYE